MRNSFVRATSREAGSWNTSAVLRDNEAVFQAPDLQGSVVAREDLSVSSSLCLCGTLPPAQLGIAANTQIPSQLLYADRATAWFKTQQLSQLQVSIRKQSAATVRTEHVCMMTQINILLPGSALSASLGPLHNNLFLSWPTNRTQQS